MRMTPDIIQSLSVIVIVQHDHRQHWTKILSLHQNIFFPFLFALVKEDHSGLDLQSFLFPFTACNDLAFGVFQEGNDALKVAIGHYVRDRLGCQSRGRRREEFSKRFVCSRQETIFQAPWKKNIIRRHAYLTGIRALAIHDSFCCKFDVGIVGVYDDGILATELEDAWSEMLCGSGGYNPCHCTVACVPDCHMVSK